MHPELLISLEKRGFRENSLVSYRKISDEIGIIVSVNSEGTLSLGADLAEEIWNQCIKTMAGQVTLLHYVRVVYQARQILEARVNSLQYDIDRKEEEINSNQRYGSTIRTNDFRRVQVLEGRLESLKQELEELLNSFKETSNDLRVLSVLFNKKPPQMGPHQPRLHVYSPSRVLDTESDTGEVFVKRSKGALQLVLILTASLLLIEPFVIGTRHHFLNLVAELAILSLFVLRNFNKVFIKFCLLLILCSLTMDILWFFGKGITLFDPALLAMDLALTPSYLTVVLSLLAIGWAIRLVIFLVLVSYLKTTETFTIQLLGLSFQLSGQSNNISRQLEPYLQ